MEKDYLSGHSISITPRVRRMLAGIRAFSLAPPRLDLDLSDYGQRQADREARDLDWNNVAGANPIPPQQPKQQEGAE